MTVRRPIHVPQGRRTAFVGLVAGLAIGTLLTACGEREPVATDIDDAPIALAMDLASRVPSGAELWLACQGCHSIDAGEPHRVGPNLHGIVGRLAASRPGYTYSQALSGSGITWSPGLLRGYVMNAESMVPGTWMAYRDVMTPAELDRLLDYVVQRAGAAESAATGDGPD